MPPVSTVPDHLCALPSLRPTDHRLPVAATPYGVGWGVTLTSRPVGLSFSRSGERESRNRRTRQRLRLGAQGSYLGPDERHFDGRGPSTCSGCRDETLLSLGDRLRDASLPSPLMSLRVPRDSQLPSGTPRHTLPVRLGRGPTCTSRVHDPHRLVEPIPHQPPSRHVALGLSGRDGRTWYALPIPEIRTNTTPQVLSRTRPWGFCLLPRPGDGGQDSPYPDPGRVPPLFFVIVSDGVTSNVSRRRLLSGVEQERDWDRDPGGDGRKGQGRGTDTTSTAPDVAGLLRALPRGEDRYSGVLGRRQGESKANLSGSGTR